MLQSSATLIFKEVRRFGLALFPGLPHWAKAGENFRFRLVGVIMVHQRLSNLSYHDSVLTNRNCNNPAGSGTLI